MIMLIVARAASWIVSTRVGQAALLAVTVSAAIGVAYTWVKSEGYKECKLEWERAELLARERARMARESAEQELADDAAAIAADRYNRSRQP